MHLVIPFASASSDAAAHALGTLSLPNLERLLGRWRHVEDARAPDLPGADEYTLSPPHERVLARLRGWPVADGLLPFAADAARQEGFAPVAGSGWGLLTPAHWHVGHDQVCLVDPATLELGEAEARVLHAALAPLFEELGWQWHWAGATRWYVSHPSLATLPTASIDRVIGRNVDLWLNDHPGVMLVRRLQSEVQMLLYTHPLNDAREARRALPVNSFWLSGTGATEGPEKSLPADVVVDDRLRAPVLADDWSTWAEAWHALDAGPVRQLADAAASAPPEPGSAPRLTLCGERVARTWQAAARPWWKTLLGARGAHAQPLLETVSAPPRLHIRDVPPRNAFALEQAGIHPLLARLFAARGVRSADELDDTLAQLLPPASLRGSADAAHLLADAIEQGKRIVIVADYDCDGATACAVALRGLQMLGAPSARLSYVVPDRQLHGYGLTPTIVDLACGEDGAGFDAARVPRPDLLVTVDNGIASLAGVAHARARGIDVLVTDHHLPALENDVVVLPDANVIVNPNQPGCAFESKALAGVGVMFYVLLATRAELRARGRFDAATQPRLDALLDLVALGTVADVVRLDANNRRLVAQGLKRIRAGRMQPGVAALFQAAARRPERASAFDFGFALGPRLNAAGRLADMTLGIECLLTDDPVRAAELAAELDRINRERRDVEAGMREQAEVLMEQIMPTGLPPAALALFHEGFHEGVVGIVAGRMKDRLHRPTFVFAVGADGYLKGSGRSIAGFHLRDALDLVSKRHPGVLRKFGGHSMAAGCTIARADFDTFDRAFAAVAQEWLSPAALARVVATDGPLGLEWFNVVTVNALDAQVWGQGFEAPTFCDEVDVVQQRLVGEKHLKLRVRHAGTLRDAIWFGHAEPVGDRVRIAYRLSVDEFQGQQRLQMVIEAVG